ncbi:MAG: DNA polymerase III subunit epsilon [Burkholderiales bacterium]|nr:DNA polymerase III subunit epsilon [Burkholderiales bacterium]
MRQIVLDTETTGLDPAAGHRIIEIGCVELVNRRLTDVNFHRYVNPGRESDEAALEVHGLTAEFLADKPPFEEIAGELLDYVRGAEVIIHNAPFDLAFLDAELARLKLPRFSAHVGAITDSLALAKERHPGRRNNLDALCERYGISNAHRTLHGALLDGALLAQVYLAMTRGQDALGMDIGDGGEGTQRAAPVAAGPLSTFVLAASADEVAAHEQLIEGIAREARAAVWSAP